MNYNTSGFGPQPSFDWIEQQRQHSAKSDHSLAQIGAYSLLDRKPPVTLIATKRFVIRSYRPEDIPAHLEFRRDAEVRRFMGFDAEADDTDCLEYLDDLHKNPLGYGDWYNLCLADPKGKHFLGDVGFKVLGDTAEISYGLHPSQRGQGLAHVAVGALVGWLFDEAKQGCIVARVDPPNVPSRRIVIGLGFCLVGHDQLSGEDLFERRRDQ